MSYTDVKELAINQIVSGIDNNHWIFTKREKTNETVKIPVLPQAMNIINKYKDAIENKISLLLIRNKNPSSNYKFSFCSFINRQSIEIFIDTGKSRLQYI